MEDGTDRPNTAILYYVAGAERVLAYVLTADGEVRSYPLLTWDQAFPLIDRFTETLAGMSSKARKTMEVERFATEWGPRLLPPAEVLRAFDVVTIVPQYSLHGLPLHVVKLGDGEYLGTSCGVAYGSSGALLRLCASRNRARMDETLPRTCMTVAGDAVGRQTGAFREVLAAFDEFFATKDWSGPFVRSQLKKCSDDVAVVVCHGYYDDIDPANCGLILDSVERLGIFERPITLSSGEVAQFRDLPFRYTPPLLDMRGDAVPEFLNIDELKVEARCDAQLVALLGCTTAAGGAAWIEDTGSLAEQWLRAGAPTVLGNIWESDVAFMRDWCRRFLGHWIDERQPKALAWAMANRDAVAAGDSLLDWGTLTLWGDWI